MPKVSVKKQRGKYRLVDAGTSRLARTGGAGVPRDGGGHKSKAKANRQAGYINNALKAKGS